MNEEDFRLKIIGDLARLDQKLEDHTEQDAINFQRIEDSLNILLERKTVAAREVRATSLKWTLPSAGVLVGLVEVIRQVLTA